MLTLLLLRHAKAALAEDGQADTDRPLTGRGRKAAAAMGRYLAGNGPVPNLVLCSPARRTTQTWDIVAIHLAARHAGFAGEVRADPAIYDFGHGERLLGVLRDHGNSASTVLLVGHNPSIGELAQRLAGAGAPGIRRMLEHKFPTGALAMLAFDAANWSEIGDRKGELVRFVRPSDLEAETG